MRLGIVSNQAGEQTLAILHFALRTAVWELLLALYGDWNKRIGFRAGRPTRTVHLHHPKMIKLQAICFQATENLNRLLTAFGLKGNVLCPIAKRV